MYIDNQFGGSIVDPWKEGLKRKAEEFEGQAKGSSCQKRVIYSEAIA